MPFRIGHTINLGRHPSEATRTKLRAAQKIRPPINEETRTKMRIAHLGHRANDETRVKLREARARQRPRVGYHASDETRAKMSASLIGHPGHHCAKTPEARAKISAAIMGDKNPHWKGGRINNGHGYECIRLHPHFYIAVHRQNMEQVLGRKLQQGEVVHHVNRNRMDNRLENLALCNNASAHGWCATEDAKLFFG